MKSPVVSEARQLAAHNKGQGASDHRASYRSPRQTFGGAYEEEQKRRKEAARFRIRKDREQDRKDHEWRVRGDNLLQTVIDKGHLAIPGPKFSDFKDDRGNVDLTAFTKARADWVELVKCVQFAAKRRGHTHGERFDWNPNWHGEADFVIFKPETIRRA